MKRTIVWISVMVLMIQASISFAGRSGNAAQERAGSQAGYTTQIQRGDLLEDVSFLVLSHRDSGILWEAPLQSRTPISVVETVVTPDWVLVLGHFQGDLQVDDLAVSAGSSGSGFLAIFDRETGYVLDLIRVGGQEQTRLLGMVAEGEDWLIIGRYAGKAFFLSLDKLMSDVDLNLDFMVGERAETHGKKAVASVTGTSESRPSYPSSQEDEGGVLTNPGDTGQDPVPVEDGDPIQITPDL